MLRRTIVALALAASTVALTGAAAHALQPTQPAVPPAPVPGAPVAEAPPTTATAPAVEKLQATVTGVEGVVQVRRAEDQPWQKAAVGMVLDENAEFRTGPRSAVQFTIPPGQTVTLDRLGTVKVLQALSENGKVKTNFGMRYGRTRYDIEAAGREHESTISSPSSTLAVRGTKVSLYDQRPFPSQAVSLTGRAEFRDARKRIRFGGPGAGKLKVDENADSAAEASLGEAVVDPATPLARTESEEALIATLLSRGATIDYDYEKGIKVLRGGTHPTTDAELIPVLPGTLNFVLRWEGNADMNLAVFSPSLQDDRQTVYPIGGLNVIRDGGRTDFDHRGGPAGGMEVAFWPGSFPEGSYRIGSVHITGPSTLATIDAFHGANRLTINSSDGPVQTAHYLSAPIDPSSGLEIEGTLAGTVRVFGNGDPPLAKSRTIPASITRARRGSFQITSAKTSPSDPRSAPAAPKRR